MPDRPAPTAAPVRAHLGLEQRLLKRYRSLARPPGFTLLVGFSGGPDSLALLTALGRVSARGGFTLLAVHVDHRLRPTSGEEQGAAADLAAALGVPFRGVRVADDPRRLHPGVGPEEAARRERYRALAAVAREVGAGLVALAHHEADQAETVLLHLLRGAGTVGARGMAELVEVRVPWWEGGEALAVTVWRPFLSEPRSAIRAYAAAIGLAPVRDPSNDDLGLRRNAVRAGVLPAIEAAAPGAVSALARFARLAADDDDALERVAASARAGVERDGALDVRALAAQPVAIRRRLVRRFVFERTGLTPTADRVEAVLAAAARGTSGRTVEMGEGVEALVERGRLLVGHRNAGTR